MPHFRSNRTYKKASLLILFLSSTVFMFHKLTTKSTIHKSITKSKLFTPFASAMSSSSTPPTKQSPSSSSSSSSPAALVFLHGLGDTPAGWSSLQFQLPSLQPSLSQLTYVFPPAPTIPITINGGMTMPGWFDLYDWPIGIGARDDEAGKRAAVEVVEREVQRLERERGISRDRIVVGGFSQGGAIALLAAYHRSLRRGSGGGGSDGGGGFAGCVSLSAWVTMVGDLELVDGSEDTPLFWGHGSFDDKVLFEQQAFGVRKLKEKGVKDVRDEQYPMGHESNPKELEQFAKFLHEILFARDDE